MLFFAHLGLALASSRLLPRPDLAFLSALAIGSMLPDIIDKPLGLIIFGSMGMGRTFAHTLLFLAILAALSLRLRDRRAAALTLGVLVHLLLDGMWASPQTLLWPLLGPFPAAELMDTTSYIEMLLSGLRDPGILLPELAGLVYLIYLARERGDEFRGKISILLEGRRMKSLCGSASLWLNSIFN